MNRKILEGMWDHLRQIHGISLRAIDRIPEDQLDARPIPGMRTMKELVVHLYTYCAGVPSGVIKGKLEASDCPEPIDRMKTKQDLIRFARQSFETGSADFARITDQQLAREVPTHWGSTMPGFVLIQVVYDEHLHHRGQLFAYLRALGVEPPFMWSFEENEPAFRPKAATA